MNNTTHYNIFLIKSKTKKMENVKILSYKNNENFDAIYNIQKKTLIRKETQNMLSEFSKTPQIGQTKVFYEKVKLPNFQEMMTMIFQYKNSGKDCKYNKNISNLIKILKNGGGLAQFITEHPKFQKSRIFGFLQETNVDENVLCIFGEIFINVARNNPVKVLHIVRDEEVQNILIRNLKKPQVMTFIYTAIFCLNNIQSSQFGNFINLVLYGLLRAPFDDTDGQSILSHCICPLSHTQQHEQQQQFQSETKIEQKVSQNFLICSELCANKSHCFFDEENQSYFDEVVDSIQNLGDMIHEVLINIDFINFENAEVLINLIIEHCYIKKLFEMLRINNRIQRKCKDDLTCQIFRLIYQIVRLFKTFTDITQHQINKNERFMPKTTIFDKKVYKRQRRYSIESMLQNIENKSKTKQNQKKIKYQQIKSRKLIHVSQQLSRWLLFYSQQMQQLKIKKRCFQQSSGLIVESIGLQRYWILKIHYQLLTIIGSTTYNIHTKYNLKAALPTLLPLIQQCMISNRWNDIIQKLIIQIIKQYLKFCYADFYHQAINIEKKSQGFLGFLIQNFRNKYYIFLNTMKFAHQGDRNTIFQISQCISLQLHLNKDLLWLFSNFPQWKQFIEKDLLEYEKSCNNKYYFNQTMIEAQFRTTTSENGKSTQAKNLGLERLTRIYKNC